MTFDVKHNYKFVGMFDVKSQTNTSSESLQCLCRSKPLTPQAACSHFVLMPLKFPLRVRRYGGDGKVSAFLITDAAGRSINLCCEETELRREVAKLFSPEEAEELAVRIARWLTDEHDTEVAIRLRQEEMSNPHSWAYRNQNG